MNLSMDNTKSLGLFLYTDYFIIFQISGFLLLLAMIGAIVLAHSDFKNSKSISPIDQKNIDKKTINVDTEKFETNQKGIYAVGDICAYPGKLKLILSGFHEGALAARACFRLARPNEKYRFEFTTSSKSIKDRLGVKE